MIEFKSANENKYAWDGDLGLFMPITPTMSAVLKEISSIDSASKEAIIEELKAEFDEEEVAYCYDLIQKYEKFKLKFNISTREVSDVDLSALAIKIHLLRHGLLQLTLNITEDCNFGCKYCVYRGFYTYSNRANSSEYMSFSTAKKAIDYYFSLFEEGKRYNPIRKTPTIGFYGGEPLLNFDLIRRCVEYINLTYYAFETHYTITTNGSCLDKDKADWLMQNNFLILLSLDGPEDEHNRNRVYKNGNPTFKEIMKNVAELESNVSKISASMVFDLKSDLFKCDEFFSRREIPIISNISSVNNPPGCRYYDQFSEEDRLGFDNQMKRAKVHYLRNFERLEDRKRIGRKNSVFDHLFCIDALKAIQGISPVISPSPLMPFTQACIPGTKIYVDAKGNFHTCERVTETNPIGDVDSGLYFEKIKSFVSDYLRHLDKCPSCDLRRVCNNCYALFIANGTFFYSSEICKKVESLVLDDFSMAFTIGEMDSAYIEQQNHFLDV
jgi:uncharacterized protein